jgi:hypothetical protein
LSACPCFPCRLPPNAAAEHLTPPAVPVHLSGLWNGTPLLLLRVEVHPPPRALGEALPLAELAVAAGEEPRLNCRPYRDSPMSPNMAYKPASRTSAA